VLPVRYELGSNIPEGRVLHFAYLIYDITFLCFLLYLSVLASLSLHKFLCSKHHFYEHVYMFIYTSLALISLTKL
jgi:hypothetical protein